MSALDLGARCTRFYCYDAEVALVMPPPEILLVAIDDSRDSLALLVASLEQNGLEIQAFADPEEAMETIYSRHPHIVITDLVMPGLSGIDVLERVMQLDPSIDVVLMTAHYSSESAVDAIKKGATDYLNKPVSTSMVRQRIDTLITEARRRLRDLALETSVLENSRFQGMLGRSPQMWEAFAKIGRIAPHYRSVLISGQTGTGKELAAQAIHKLSPAAQGNFVIVNCSAIVETLFESELFGHIKGSFTGASHDKMGLFEHAHRGTLFLDEIGDMPIGTQAKLLRALQNQEVQRVGSLTPRKVDVHVIAATHRDLRARAATGEFREDLYYRLAMVELALPSLADRKEDLNLLIRHFIAHFSADYKKEIRGITQRAQIVLSRHSWPGNVRELENAIGHACMMVVGDTIDVMELPAHLRQSVKPGPTTSAPDYDNAVAPLFGDPPKRDESLAAQEKEIVVKALERVHGNQADAARHLRIGRNALRYKMKKHGLL